MTKFDAFKAGTADYYKSLKDDNFKSKDTKKGKLEEEYWDVYRLGMNLGSAHYMVMTADLNYEFERDIADYNNVVHVINKTFGKTIVPPLPDGSWGDDTFMGIHPDTGEKVNLF